MHENSMKDQLGDLIDGDGLTFVIESLRDACLDRAKNWKTCRAAKGYRRVAHKLGDARNVSTEVGLD